MLSVLDKKLMRDAWRLYAQIIAIALVMACGVATIIIGVGAYRSLEHTRSAFYERYHFANIFASAVRAPLHLHHRINRIEGVATSDLRLVEPVLLDVQGMSEPGAGILISVPDHGNSNLNQIYMRKGRMPLSGRSNEVVVVESFASAHGFEPGNSFDAIVKGQKLSLKIVGIGLSPEYIYSIGPGDMVPDPARFGVIFMSEKLMAGLLDMEGAFNNVAVSTLTGAIDNQVVEELDLILEPYGGAGAYKREDQTSHLFLDAELTQLYAMARIIPPIFLLVSAFLINMILSRVITLEREQIGLLKAIGYGNFGIGWHYGKFVVLIAVIGLIIGSIAGTWLGQGMARLYSTFFSFPFLIFDRSTDLYVIAGGITVFSALIGATKAIWSTVVLPPAVAMRPPAPSSYRSLFGTNSHKIQLFSQLSVMAFRHMYRHPLRTGLTIVGVALSVALLVTAMFSTDSLDHLIDTIFHRSDRQDVVLTFSTERGFDGLTEVRALPGVLRAEPVRNVPVIMRNGLHEERLAITGIPENTMLSRVLDLDLKAVNPTNAGLLVSEKVASELNVRGGDFLEIELLEQGRKIAALPVTSITSGVSPEDATRSPLMIGQPIIGLSQGYVGMTAYMQLDKLNRLIGDGPRISGANVLVDAARLPQLYLAIKETPGIATIALQNKSQEKFRETIDQNIQMMMTVYVVLAVIITFGVVYNSARIQLSERARELASLRVFGFTRTEVSSVMLTELAVIVLLAQPLGWLLGFSFSFAVIKGFESEAFRVPLVIHPSTFAQSSLTVLGAALLTAMLVRRRINGLDLIKVLKTRE